VKNDHHEPLLVPLDADGYLVVSKAQPTNPKEPGKAADLGSFPRDSYYAMYVLGSSNFMQQTEAYFYACGD
jgi:hypothetical protein